MLEKFCTVPAGRQKLQIELHAPLSSTESKFFQVKKKQKCGIITLVGVTTYSYQFSL